MITLTYKVPARSMADSDDPKEKTWSVGDVPLYEQLDDAGLEVISLVAEGEEYWHILEHFRNIPYHLSGRM